MSNKEAVILLKSLLEVIEEDKTDDYDEALKKAIEALYLMCMATDKTINIYKGKEDVCDKGKFKEKI